MSTPLGPRQSVALRGAALVLALSAVIAGCGGQDGSTTGSPAVPPSTPTTGVPSSPEPAPDNDWELLDLVSETNAGGSTSTETTPVGDPDALSTYLDQFSSDVLAEEVTDAVTSHQTREGYAVAAAVVAVGCDVPPDVTYADGMIRATKVAKPLPECFAPVTTVAVIEVPAGS